MTDALMHWCTVGWCTVGWCTVGWCTVGKCTDRGHRERSSHADRLLLWQARPVARRSAPLRASSASPWLRGEETTSDGW